MTSFTFTTSLPPRVLNPNAGAHRMLLYRAKKRYKQTVWGDCLLARPKGWNGQAAAYKLDLAFFHKEARGRDDDNFISSFKAGRDALVDARIAPNDSLFCMGTVTLAVDAKKPRLEVTVTILEDATP